MIVWSDKTPGFVTRRKVDELAALSTQMTSPPPRTDLDIYRACIDDKLLSEHANDSYNDIRWDLHKFTQVSLPLSAYSSQQRERDRRGVFVMFVGHIDRQVGK